MLMDSARAFLAVQQERDALRDHNAELEARAEQMPSLFERNSALEEALRDVGRYLSGSGTRADHIVVASIENVLDAATGSNEAILPLDTPDDAPSLRRAVEKVRDTTLRNSPDTQSSAREPELKVTKMVGVIPHDCEGGAGCAFPDLEHVRNSDVQHLVGLNAKEEKK